MTLEGVKDDTSRPMSGIAFLAILAGTIWVYRSAFHCFFIQDDFAWLSISRFQSLGEFLRCFFRYNGAGNYRPLSQEAYFWGVQQAAGLSPGVFHAIGIATHLAAVLLLYLLLRRFFSRLPSLTGACVYAVHGAHVISLHWISAYPEPLAMIFLLSAILLFVTFDRQGHGFFYVCSLAAMLVGVAAKESILSLPLILTGYCLLLSRRCLLWTLPYYGITAACLLLRVTSDVALAPYELSFGAGTLQNIATYLSWMGGFSESIMRSSLDLTLPGGYYLIAAGFLGVLTALFLFSRDRRVAGFGLVWIAAALQPVLYFENHAYPYYLAPALVGLSLMFASALDGGRARGSRLRLLVVLAFALAGFGLGYRTIRMEGNWWVRRSEQRRQFLDTMRSINRRIPPDGICYIVGIGSEELENLENGNLFKAYHLDPHRLRFVLPSIDPDLSSKWSKLRRTGEIDKAYCFVVRKNEIINQTAAFREGPERVVQEQPAQFAEIPGVALEVTPAVVSRGKDTFVLRLVGLKAEAIDLVYSVNGEVMPPVFDWRLDRRNEARVFADWTTPVGEYRFRALRSSSRKDGAWIRVDAGTIVR